MELQKYMGDIEKSTTIPTTEELQRISEAVQATKNMNIDYFQQAKRLQEAIQPHYIEDARKQMELHLKTFPIENLTKAIEHINNINFDVYFRNIKLFTEAIKQTSSSISILENSGIFEALSNVSSNITAIETITKLNVILSEFETIKYDIDISNNDSIIVDNEIVTREEIIDVSEEFKEITLEKLTFNQTIEKIKSRKWFVFVVILGWLMKSLIIEPIFDKLFDEIRQRTGIDKVIEKFEIGNWIDEISNLINDKHTDYCNKKENTNEN